MRRDSGQQRVLTRRAALVGGAKLGLFGLLAGRLWYLQVVEAERYTTLAEDNRVAIRLFPPTRGLIQDRAGRPLALNTRAYRVSIVPEQAGDVDAVLARLDRIVPLGDELRERVTSQVGRNRSFVPIVVFENLGWEDLARISVRLPDLPGLRIDETEHRFYPEGPGLAHVVGYVGAVSKEELTGDPVLSLPGFKIGKAGVERTHDEELRGEAARSEVEVNAVGREIRELTRYEGAPGKEIGLSIDVELQRLALQRLGTESGTVVAMDVHSGEVVVMASAPTFDPNPFSAGISRDDWRALMNDPEGPLNNKCISGLYAPGSTFKMAVALAALEAGVVSRSQTFFCNGVLRLGEGRFHCWKRHGHGFMSLHDAIAQSCDVYFYEVAKRVGIDRIEAMSRRLGLGVPLGVDLPQELPGLIPTREWKRRRFDKPWHVGETLIASIGQGFVLTTPLQLAVMTARLVNGGRAVAPRVTRTIDGERVAVADFPPLGIDEELLAPIRDAMVAVTSDPRGTARAAQIADEALRMGGKTGTSQVRRISLRERRTGVIRNEDRPREERDHALFVGYAPLSRPRWSIAVVVEHGGGGSTVAAPIARDVLEAIQKRLGGSGVAAVAGRERG